MAFVEASASPSTRTRISVEQTRQQLLARELKVGRDFAEDCPGEIARQLHAAKTSSRTKCIRISLGTFPSSK